MLIRSGFREMGTSVGGSSVDHSVGGSSVDYGGAGAGISGGV